MRISDWSSDVCSSDLPGRNTLLELADDEVGDFGGDIAARAFRKGHGASPCGRGKGRRHGTTRRRQGIQEKAASGRESVLIGRFRFDFAGTGHYLVDASPATLFGKIGSASCWERWRQFV